MDGLLGACICSDFLNITASLPASSNAYRSCTDTQETRVPGIPVIRKTNKNRFVDKLLITQHGLGIYRRE